MAPLRPDRLGCQDIPGATAQNYVPTAPTSAPTLRARVTGKFIGSSEQGTPQDSAATAVVAVGPPPPTSSSKRVVSLTAALKTHRSVSVHRLLKRGLGIRAHCSKACRVRLDLVGRGAVKLAHLSGSISKAGSHTFTLHLNRKARRIVRRYHSGTLTLWLHVKSRDGQQQTVSRVLHLKK